MPEIRSHTLSHRLDDNAQRSNKRHLSLLQPFWLAYSSSRLTVQLSPRSNFLADTLHKALLAQRNDKDLRIDSSCLHAMHTPGAHPTS